MSKYAAVEMHYVNGTDVFCELCDGPTEYVNKFYVIELEHPKFGYIQHCVLECCKDSLDIIDWKEVINELF